MLRNAHTRLALYPSGELSYFLDPAADRDTIDSISLLPIH